MWLPDGWGSRTAVSWGSMAAAYPTRPPVIRRRATVQPREGHGSGRWGVGGVGTAGRRAGEIAERPGGRGPALVLVAGAVHRRPVGVLGGGAELEQAQLP